MIKSISGARIDQGFTIQEAALYVEISVEKLEKYEIKPSEMPLNIAKKLLKLYKIHIDAVCFN